MERCSVFVAEDLTMGETPGMVYAAKLSGAMIERLSRLASLALAFSPRA